MSEYWVSKNKYFCKYCDIYIADDAPSRRQHENGLRHQGNRDRFVRGLYKEGERRKKDIAEEKREMARIEAAANASFAMDVHSGLATGASSSVPASASNSTPAKPAKPASKWTNYSTAQSLGYVDPDEERMKAELEHKRTQGLAGAWEVVAPPPPPMHISSAEDDAVKSEGIAGDRYPVSIGQKREAEENPDDVHGFKFRKRKMEAGLGELWDPGDVSVKVRKRNAPPVDEDDAPVSNQVKDEDAGRRCGSSVKPEHSEAEATAISDETHKMVGGWRKATVSVEPTTDVYHDPVKPREEPSNSVKREKSPLPSSLPGDTLAQCSPPIKAEPDDLNSSQATTEVSVSSGGMFRKRKVRAGGRASGSGRS